MGLTADGRYPPGEKPRTVTDSDVNAELERTGTVDESLLGKADIEHDEGAQPHSPRGQAARTAENADNVPEHGNSDPADFHPGGPEAADPPNRTP
ncbi:hypothetical protein [Kribbella deserti]|uniref:Uncharacterized protein n=1 Tax=Kribbella deserti TaxID=1926257 RepID=A0ABV6QH86_9ACTN